MALFGPRIRKGIFVAAFFAGILLRLLAALQGDNYDMESWWIGSEAVKSGHSIYSSTTRYNYGPLWALILLGFRNLNELIGIDSIRALHICITLLLSLTDIALALLLFRRRHPRLALFFFLNPISIVVSGYHVQFDNLAVLLGIWGWRFFCSAKTLQAVVTAGAILGVSLSTKHVFSIFLAWLPFITGVHTLKERGIFACVGLSVFVASFLPWVSDPESWIGIQKNVLSYTSTEGHTLVSSIGRMIWVPNDRSVFIFSLVLTGFLVSLRKHLHTSAELYYLIAITALSSGMARNYLAIPLAALCSLSPLYLTLPYFVVSTLALLTNTPGLGTSEVVLQLTTIPIASYPLSQLSLLLPLFILWIGEVPHLCARFVK